MDLRAKKEFGQNFLGSQAVVETMLETGAVDSRDIVVEAGPGKGILTEGLLRCAREVIAIEKDPRLVLFLTLKFKPQIDDEKLALITGDVLTFDPSARQLQPGGYKVVANIPYYLTGHFLRHFLSLPTPPSRMVLMVQDEVAQRVCATDEKESILSLSVKAYGTPRYIEKIPAALFHPRPRVDSALLLIENISKSFFKNLDEARFFEVLKAGFRQKRKRLSSNLSALAAPEKIRELFRRHGISENARAEEIPLLKWKAIASEL